MNIYLIASDSYKKINDEVNKILGDFSNVIKYDLRVSSINDVINEANYFSLTNEQKYIIVKSNNLFKASKKDDTKEDTSKDSELLENYIKNPNELATIIFTSLEMPDKRKKIFKEIEKNGKVVLLPALNKKELTYECMDLLKKKGYIANYETANFIVDNSYVNYDIMTNELEKIYTLITPGNIDINKIENIISKSLLNTSYSFVNAIINRDLENAIYLSKNFERLKIEPSAIISILASEFEIMLMIKQKVNLKDLQNYLHKEDWQMKSYLNNANMYNESEIKKIIIKLNDYDYKLKSGLLDKSVILNLIALDLCD